jgi:hypothetical protein
MVRDIPISEVILRKYEKPYELSKRELTRKICLSIGLLQPGDSRDIIIDLLLTLEESRKNKEWISSFDIIKKIQESRKNNSLELKGLAESNIRRQLKRLRDFLLVDKQNNLYRISEFSSLSELFEKNIESFIIPQTLERVKEYLSRFSQ